MTKRFLRYGLPLLILAIAPLALAQDNEGGSGKTFAEMFFYSDDVVGFLIIWFMILLSMTSNGFSLFLAIKYRRSTLLPFETRSELETLLAEKKYREAIDYANSDDSYLGKLCAGALNEAANGFSAMERAVEEVGDAETSRVLRPVEYLNVLGNIAPMMGLFGTVYGMIISFDRLASSSGQADPGNLAGGIGTALLTTLWGLVVAIPALACYALIRNKIDALTSEGLVLAEELISPFKPGAKRSSGSSSSSSSSSRPQPQPQS